MFTEYAESQLSDRMNETTQEDISAFVGTLLQNSSFEIDALRCASNDSNELSPEPSPARQSEAMKVRQYIAKLPRESVSVLQAAYRVVPNTPFNRKYHISTIVNNKNNFIPNLKRSYKTSPEELKPKRAHLDFKTYEEPSQDITIISSYDETLLKHEWKVESLDECEISEIPGQKLPIKIEPVKFVPKFSIKFDPRASSIGRIQVKQSFKTPPVQQRKISASRTPPQADQSNSILEVPSLPSVNILEVETLPLLTSIATPLTNETLRAAPDVRVIPKVLNWSGNTSNGTVNDLSQPPSWFQSFLTRYDADMSHINTKMDSIVKKLDKIIEQTSFDLLMTDK